MQLGASETLLNARDTYLGAFKTSAKASATSPAAPQPSRCGFDGGSRNFNSSRLSSATVADLGGSSWKIQSFEPLLVGAKSPLGGFCTPRWTPTGSASSPHWLPMRMMKDAASHPRLRWLVTSNAAGHGSTESSPIWQLKACWKRQLVPDETAEQPLAAIGWRKCHSRPAMLSPGHGHVMQMARPVTHMTRVSLNLNRIKLTSP